MIAPFLAFGALARGRRVGRGELRHPARCRPGFAGALGVPGRVPRGRVRRRCCGPRCCGCDGPRSTNGSASASAPRPAGRPRSAPRAVPTRQSGVVAVTDVETLVDIEIRGWRGRMRLRLPPASSRTRSSTWTSRSGWCPTARHERRPSSSGTCGSGRRTPVKHGLISMTLDEAAVAVWFPTAEPLPRAGRLRRAAGRGVRAVGRPVPHPGRHVRGAPPARRAAPPPGVPGRPAGVPGRGLGTRAAAATTTRCTRTWPMYLEASSRSRGRCTCGTATWTGGGSRCRRTARRCGRCGGRPPLCRPCVDEGAGCWRAPRPFTPCATVRAVRGPCVDHRARGYVVPTGVRVGGGRYGGWIELGGQP